MWFIQFFRLLQINKVLMQHTFNRSVLGSRSRSWRFLSYLNPLSFTKQGKTRGESLRLALESLGPIFVKFGQLLSTRHDLLPKDIIQELSKLQDCVPPFANEIALDLMKKTYGKHPDELFKYFDQNPLASASVAQVHAATLKDGSDVIVKILRPKIKRTIRHDIALMYNAARIIERWWSQGKRLHPIALVKEFEQTIYDELDLMREAANASQLRRNFQNSSIMYVPKIYWEFSKKNIMVMERIYGTPISDIDTLKKHNTDMKKLAEYGVEIFFTQVFRDSFFHADMHPGNLFVDIQDPQNPKYIGVDFGIMGTLNPVDQHYLAANMLAFFNRDYRQVATLHVESGWVPADTRIDQFESAIRTVCEPIFEKPLKDISFAQLLIRLFQTAERFQMEIQPQLMLLQKTLLAIEGLGRQLYPELDLWETAKPFLEKQLKKQYNFTGLLREFVTHLPENLDKMAQTPALLFDVLQNLNAKQRHQPTPLNITPPKKVSHRRGFLFGAGTAIIVLVVGSIAWHHQSLITLTHQQISSLGTGGGLMLLGWLFG